MTSTSTASADPKAAASAWSQLFGFGCSCTPDDDEILLNLGASQMECCYRPEDDHLGEDDFGKRGFCSSPETQSFTLEANRIGGLRGMSSMKGAATADIDDLEEDLLKELEAMMDDLCNLRSELFAEKGWEIHHLEDDMYSINDRSVRLFLLPATFPLPDCRHLSNKLGPGTTHLAAGIMVHDGPLRQPLFDYLVVTGINEHYDARGTENPSAVTGYARSLSLSLYDTDDRIDAMRHATAVADMRQRAAHRSPTCGSLRAGVGSKLSEMRGAMDSLAGSPAKSTASNRTNSPCRDPRQRAAITPCSSGAAAAFPPGPSRFSNGLGGPRFATQGGA